MRLFVENFIKSVSTKVPRKFYEFQQSGCNKTRLIELPFEYLQLNKNEVLQTSRSDNLVCSSNDSWEVNSRVAVMEDLNLSSYQKEGDTKIILHCADVVHRSHGENACIRSSSGDTAVVVLTVGLLQELIDWVFIVNGNGSNKEHYKLSVFETDIDSTIAFFGLHAFRVNDYMCCHFSAKEKKNVGSWWETAERLKVQLENEVNNGDQLMNYLANQTNSYINFMVTKKKM